MSQSALNVHLKNLKETGTLLVDRELVPDISEVKAKVFAFSTTQIAEKALHSKIYANVIMLGALTQITRVTSDEAMKQAIRDSVRANTVKVNLVAFEQGLRLQPS
jgi:2-oxoglutarate ferredoxin oxidoreductase subunit gamma